MSFFTVFKRKQQDIYPGETTCDRGLLVFENTSEVIRAERVLKAKGWNIRVMGPPPEIRSGCDLVIEIPLMLPREVVPVTSPLLHPVDLFKVKYIDRYLMVRAANMKLTVDMETTIIVNVSGGGCPDVPYLAQEMVGRKLMEAPSPREIGHTLCGYALQLAYEEVSSKCMQ